MNADEMLAYMRPLVITVSGLGEVKASTGGFGGFFGHDPADLLGRNVFEYVTPEAHAELATYFIESGGESAQTASLPVPFRVDILGADQTPHAVDVIASGQPLPDGSWDWLVVLVPLSLQTAHTRSLDAEMAGEPRARIKQLLADEATVDNDHYTTRAFFVDLSVPDEITVTAARPGDEHIAELIRVGHVEESWAPWCDVARGETVAIADKRKPAGLTSVMADKGWRRISITAVRSGQELLGAFVVMGRVPEDYPVDVVMANVRALLRRLADATELIMTRWIERDLLTIAATRDSLTGLSNRTGLIAAMEDRPDVDIALLYIDVDDFKSVNDRYGHRVGDLALAEIGRRIANVCRSGSIVARLGGDEFVVVLSGVDTDEARAIGERVVEAVARPLEIPDGPEQVTISAGMAPPTGGREGQRFTTELIDRADEAMLYAKRAGRARLVVGGDRS